MATGRRSHENTTVEELAEAISSFDISRISDLLSDSGIYSTRDEYDKVILSDKKTFIEWLNGNYHTFLRTVRHSQRLTFNIVQSMHSIKGDPVIIFEDGRFPVFGLNHTENAKIGMVIISGSDHITRIEFCLLIMKTEFPFIYERKTLKPEI